MIIKEFSELRGLNVVFINMPLREMARPNVPPQGPLLLASRLRSHGADVSIVDLNAYRIIDELSEAKRASLGRHLTENEVKFLLESHFNKFGEPDIIALSGMITTLRWQKIVANICRKTSPQSFMISGGGLATEIRGELFNWINDIDAIGHSEGDDIILVIAKEILDLKKNGAFNNFDRNLNSPFYFGKINGRHRFLYPGSRPKDLNSLPLPALDLLEVDVFGNRLLDWYIDTPVWGGSANNSSATPFTMKKSLTTVSSRGCPYNCAFCYRGSQGERNYRMRSAENLFQEAKILKDKYAIDFLGYPDDNFAVDTKRLKLLPLLFKEIELRWGTHTRIDEADERLKDMADSGCIYIGFGAESASKKILEKMGKGGFILKKGMIKIPGYDFEFPRTMIEGINNCLIYGIHSNCTWIMGYPGETLNDLKKSVSFILWQIENVSKELTPGTESHKIAVGSINKKMFTATAYPGTRMFSDPHVTKILNKHFEIKFSNKRELIFDDKLQNYVLELDDATKVLLDKNGEPLNFSEMSNEIFLEARKKIDNGRIEDILNM
ncbi:MAG: hypothetical protein UT05_C0002G0060 [Parcubacteria group bacterium GW2011_GWF2_38_76]|nr:MAG: hypothetical protein UT05_C0002G0060 [Parcubacteria group bacterium GW2011_GWF2_38_76]HBM45782.1 hypothetical protein [Patescibacteria group bacterium]